MFNWYFHPITWSPKLMSGPAARQYTDMLVSSQLRTNPRIIINQDIRKIKTIPIVLPLTFHYFYHRIVFIGRQRSLSKSTHSCFFTKTRNKVAVQCSLGLMKQQKWSDCKSLSGWAMTCPVLARRERTGLVDVNIIVT